LRRPRIEDGDVFITNRTRGLSAEDGGRPAGTLSRRRPEQGRMPYTLDLVEELCVGGTALALDATMDSVGHGLRLLALHG
jgi:hypothetical protein